MNDKFLQAACAYLGVEVGQVLSWKVYEDKVVLVVDKGIAGCPKFNVNRAMLEMPAPQVPPPAAAPPAPKRKERR